jgi:cytochrome c553
MKDRFNNPNPPVDRHSRKHWPETNRDDELLQSRRRNPLQPERPLDSQAAETSNAAGIPVHKIRLSMKYRLAAPLALFLAILAPVNPALAAGNAEAGKAKTTICQACHGVDGNNPINPTWSQLTVEDIKKMAADPKLRLANPVWAKLAGQNADYLVKQLRNFRSGARKDPIMTDMAGGLSDADIADIAAYYSAQPMRPEAPDQGPVAKHGEDVYLHGNPKVGLPACASCHGPTAHGTETLPRLAGQHAIYLQKQLWFFKLGTRTTDKRMNDVAAKLSDDDIRSVAVYLSGIAN